MEQKKEYESILKKDLGDLFELIDKYGHLSEVVGSFVLEAENHYENPDDKKDFMETAAGLIYHREKLGGFGFYEYIKFLMIQEKLEKGLGGLEKELEDKGFLSNFFRGNYAKRRAYQSSLKDLDCRIQLYEKQLSESDGRGKNE